MFLRFSLLSLMIFLLAPSTQPLTEVELIAKVEEYIEQKSSDHRLEILEEISDSLSKRKYSSQVLGYVRAFLLEEAKKTYGTGNMREVDSMSGIIDLRVNAARMYIKYFGYYNPVVEQNASYLHQAISHLARPLEIAAVRMAVLKELVLQALEVPDAMTFSLKVSGYPQTQMTTLNAFEELENIAKNHRLSTTRLEAKRVLAEVNDRYQHFEKIGSTNPTKNSQHCRERF